MATNGIKNNHRFKSEFQTGTKNEKTNDFKTNGFAIQTTYCQMPPENFHENLVPLPTYSTTHLPFLSSNPKILKAFLKTFPTKMKPTKCPAKEKKMRQEKRKKKGRGEKAKSNLEI